MPMPTPRHLPASPRCAPNRPIALRRRRAGRPHDPAQHGRRGFTLIELLIVISILALLISLLLPALSSAREAAAATRASGHIRQLQMAHINYSFDHRDQILPGYRSADPPRWTGEVRNHEGKLLRPPIGDRWTWRLAKYFNWDWELLYYDREVPGDDYRKSVFPRFGLNTYFVGGSKDGIAFVYDNQGNEIGRGKYGPFYLRTMSESDRPDRQLVFADSVYSESNQPLDVHADEGFHQLQPPNFAERLWDLEKPAKKRTAADVGFVAERWRGRTTVTFLDGHSDSLTLEELDDMRLWAPLARSQNWVLTDGW